MCSRRNRLLHEFSADAEISVANWRTLCYSMQTNDKFSCAALLSSPPPRRTSLPARTQLATDCKNRDQVLCCKTNLLIWGHTLIDSATPMQKVWTSPLLRHDMRIVYYDRLLRILSIEIFAEPCVGLHHCVPRFNSVFVLPTKNRTSIAVPRFSF